ncbi:MAG: Gfo/Idh/MocA family protein [Chloroflexota bacterium]
MDTINVGIIGTGSISSAHVEAYQRLPGVRVIAACSTNAERAGRFAARYGIPHVFTDHRELLAMEKLCAVSVATWNNSHAPISIAALRAGKHVLCEKPLAMNAAEAADMVATARDTGKLLMVGMCRRFSEKARALRAMVERGDLGSLYYAKTGYIRRWGNPGGWFANKQLSGGGPVIDLGVHIIDLVRFLAGGPRATAVSAAVFDRLGMRPEVRGVSKYRSASYSEYNDVEDGATALIRFDSGLVLTAEVSWVQNIKEDRMYLELYGDRAGAQLDPEFEIYGNIGPHLTDTRPLIDPELNRSRHSINEQAAHFIDCIANGTPCLSPAEDGLEMMRIIDAIYESARQGREITIDRSEP